MLAGWPRIFGRRSPRPRLARLHADGALEESFARNDGVVHSCALLPAGRVLIGGRFSEVNGQLHPGLARLLPDGNLDMTFDSGTGPDEAVTALVPLSDGTVMAGGWFSKINGASCRGLALLSGGGAAVVLGSHQAADGAINISAMVLPGCPHVLERSVDLNTWVPVNTNVPNGSPWLFIDRGVPDASRWFYRVKRGDF